MLPLNPDDERLVGFSVLACLRPKDRHCDDAVVQHFIDYEQTASLTRRYLIARLAGTSGSCTKYSHVARQ